MLLQNINRKSYLASQMQPVDLLIWWRKCPKLLLLNFALDISEMVQPIAMWLLITFGYCLCAGTVELA